MSQTDFRTGNTFNPPLESRGTDSSSKSISHASRVGNLKGRPVVAGAIPWDHRVANRTGYLASSIAAPLLGAAAGFTRGWGPYWLGMIGVETQDGVETDSALAAGAILAGAAALGLRKGGVALYDAWNQKSDRAALVRRNATPQEQLDHIARSAVESGPLTLAGIDAALGRMKKLRTLHPEIPNESFLRAIAKLGGAIPTEASSGCGPSRWIADAPVKYVQHLTEAMNGYREGGSAPTDSNKSLSEAHRDALISLAHQVGAQPSDNKQNPRDLAALEDALSPVFNELTAGLLPDPQQASTLEQREICAMTAAAMKAAPVVRDAEDDRFQGMLSLLNPKDDGKGVTTRPVDHKHTPALHDANKTAFEELVTEPLKKIDSIKDVKLQAQAYDQLLDRICQADRGGVPPSSFDELNAHLSKHSESPSPAKEAIARLRFMTNHWLGGRSDSESKASSAAPMRQLALKMNQAAEPTWASAPCTVLQHLAFLSKNSKNDETLKTLTQASCHPDHIKQRLKSASPASLREETAAALNIIRHTVKDPADRAKAYLAIHDLLKARTDLPPQMFIGGILPAQTTEKLSDTIGTKIEQARKAGQPDKIKELSTLKQRLLSLSPGHGDTSRSSTEHTASFEAWLKAVSSASTAPEFASYGAEIGTAEIDEDNDVRVTIHDQKK